jgi:hypothetical protein
MFRTGRTTSLDKNQWGNIASGAMCAVFVDAVLAIGGVALDTVLGDPPVAYWYVAIILGAVVTVSLIGCSIWGALTSNALQNSHPDYYGGANVQYAFTRDFTHVHTR